MHRTCDINAIGSCDTKAVRVHAIGVLAAPKVYAASGGMSSYFAKSVLASVLPPSRFCARLRHLVRVGDGG